MEKCQKMKEDGIHGPPDFMVETLVPCNELILRSSNLPTYRRRGVREFWIMDLCTQSVEVYLNKASDDVKYTVLGKGKHSDLQCMLTEVTQRDFIQLVGDGSEIRIQIQRFGTNLIAAHVKHAVWSYSFPGLGI